jgi:Bacterial regulatory proteins, luxR family
VARLLANGATAAQISPTRDLSERTVCNYTSYLMSKCGAENRLDLIRIVRVQGWVCVRKADHQWIAAVDVGMGDSRRLRADQILGSRSRQGAEDIDRSRIATGRSSFRYSNGFAAHDLHTPRR